MSDVVDFESRDRSGTTQSLQPPLSPIAPTDQHRDSRDRRGSTVSRLSAKSPTDDGIRHRHIFRSNTVKTLQERESDEPTWQPAAEPGIDPFADDERLPAKVSSLKAQCEIQITDYSDFEVRHIQADNESLPQVLEEPRPDSLPCRWISVNGLSWDVIKCLARKYNLHRLAIEDMVHSHTRTKVDWYSDHACVILTLQKLVRLPHDYYEDADEDEDETDEKAQHRPKTKSKSKSKPKWWQWWRRTKKARRRKSELPYWIDKDDDGHIDEWVNAHTNTNEDAPIRRVRTLHRWESSQIPAHTVFMEKHSTLASEDLAVSVEQVAIFLLAKNTVISFFEQSAEDVDLPIQDRLQSTETMLRRSCDASLLLQAIIDAIVDLAVPVKEAYNRARKELQIDAMVNPNIRTSRALHIFGEEIDMLQNLIKPIVHLVNALRDHNSDPSGNPIAMAPPPPDDHATPLRTEKTRRDREGAPLFARKPSDFAKRATVVRADTATSVAITQLAHTYFGDVLDHVITMIQALEQMDASATNISTLIFNTVGARTNNFMMILAVVTVFFAPLTFISGYFGQNFAGGAGLDHPFAFFWYVSIPVLIVFMGIVFATMLWDNIKDWWSKYGMRVYRRKRDKQRRAARKYTGY